MLECSLMASRQDTIIDGIGNPYLDNSRILLPRYNLYKKSESTMKFDSFSHYKGLFYIYIVAHIALDLLNRLLYDNELTLTILFVKVVYYAATFQIDVFENIFLRINNSISHTSKSPPKLGPFAQILHQGIRELLVFFKSQIVDPS